MLLPAGRENARCTAASIFTILGASCFSGCGHGTAPAGRRGWPATTALKCALQTEQKYRSVSYASTQHSDAARWPKLSITYTQMQEAYYLKDHLGNIRVTLDGNGNVVTTDDYYPFGLQMPGRSYNIALTGSIYKYAGKELDEESGLDWYYFGARSTSFFDYKNRSIGTSKVYLIF